MSPLPDHVAGTLVTQALVALFTPALMALVLVALPPLRRRGTPAAVLCILGSLVATAASLMLLAAALSPTLTAPLHVERIVSWLPVDGRSLAEIGLLLDPTSVSMLVVVCFVALCVQVFSLGYMHDEDAPSRGRYFTFHALFLFSMNSLVIAPNLLQLFAGWELVGVTSYLLIGYYYKKPSAARAAVKAFWVTKFADMGFLVGLLVLFVASGSFGWQAQLDPTTATVVTALLFLAVVGKSAQFPLHVWLPDAMEGPTPVSALLHAATMVAAGVYLIVRADPLFAQSETTRNVMMIIGSVTALMAAFLALVQTDLKKVLAYSTCSQLGYMVVALGAGARFAGFFHLTTHAFFKALLFLAAGSVIHAVHSNSMSDMGGLRRKMPITTTVFVIGALALSGIPGFSGFFSKDLVLAAVEDKLGWAPFAALLLAAFLTAFYMGRTLVLTFFGKESERSEHAHEPGVAMLLPLVALALLALGAGWFGGTLAHLQDVEYHLHFGATPIAASLLGLVGLAAGFVVYGNGRAAPAFASLIARIAETRAWNRLYEWIFARVLLGVAQALGWFDRYVIDGVINWVGWAFIEGGRAMRPMQTGRAPDYVLAVVLGAIALAAWGMY